MKIILRADVEPLGTIGDVKEVSPGYARNYLLPRRLASMATAEALKGWERGKEKRAKIKAEATAVKKTLAEKLAAVSLQFSRPSSPEGALFGSVGKSDIVQSLKTCGFEIDRQAVRLESALKQTGVHEVEIRLGHEISAMVKVTISPRQ
jgi:large subunit ribosomal protein L9